MNDTIFLFYKEYDPNNNHCIRKITKLAEEEAFKVVGQSTEKLFRSFLAKNKSLIINGLIDKAKFFKAEIRASGLYWNKSYLFIPTVGSENYYTVAFYS